ncbi:MAG: FemAB family PEP-CTERM system-associated protein [Betaproteobacteria bacterium]|nr:FemAB family PEP-CTERM system-associated protein [Betaproteobacteria bacterium]
MTRARLPGALEVCTLSPDWMPRWDAFVERCPEASFFHLSGWQQVIERAFGHRTHFLLAHRNGEVEGVLPLAEIRSLLFGHSLSSLPFCVYGGPAAASDAARAALDETAQQCASRLRVGALEYRMAKPLHPDWAISRLYSTFRKPIEPEVERNLLAIPRKQRAMVRKGIKAGLAAELDAGTERLYFAYASSVHRLGTPVFGRHYFRLLKEVFGSRCEILTVLRERRVIASVMSFYFRDEVLPYYGGGTDEAREVAGNDFMYWELMRRACEKGVRLFDYGRSKEGTGAFEFKRNWGFEPQPLYYEYQLHHAKAVPEVNPLNPKYRLFIKAWQRLPLWAANLIGPHIVRQLG